MLFGLMMMATLLAGNLPVPWQVIAPVAGIGTLVYGVRALIKVRKLRWPGMLSPHAHRGPDAHVAQGTTAKRTTYWDEQVAYQECRENAVTIAAQERCEREWDEARSPESS